MTGRRLAGCALVLACATSFPAVAAVVGCSVAAVGPAFGVYTPSSPSPLTATGSVTATCTLTSGGATFVTLTVALSTGASGIYDTRTMLSGVSALTYNLYQLASYQQVWGDGSGVSATETATVHVNPGNPTQQAVLTIYGQIDAGQDVAIGDYLDTIVVTVNY